MSADAPSIGLEGRTVLLLEDESLIVLDLRQALEDSGARVLVSAGLEQAFAQLERTRPHVAVLDVTLAGGSTCEPLALRLRELGIPVLLYTGDIERHRDLIGRLGVPHAVKPVASHLLVRRIARLIDQHSSSA